MDESFSYTPAPMKARVEIIPLIDVVFFLLATFVLFTLSLEKITSLEVTLPRASGEMPIGPDTTVYIQASERGAFYWKQGRDAPAEFATAAEIPARLADYKRHTADPRVLIRGDDLATFGSAITILDQVRHAGISQVAIETKRSATGK
jgi:biopolymer transport protein ExbD